MKNVEKTHDLVAGVWVMKSWVAEEYRRSVESQMHDWLKGINRHTRDLPDGIEPECCPDLSCCLPNRAWPLDTRREYALSTNAVREQMRSDMQIKQAFSIVDNAHRWAAAKASHTISIVRRTSSIIEYLVRIPRKRAVLVHVRLRDSLPAEKLSLFLSRVGINTSLLLMQAATQAHNNGWKRIYLYPFLHPKGIVVFADNKAGNAYFRVGQYPFA